MHLIQFTDENGARAVGFTEAGATRVVTGAASVYALAAEAAETGRSLSDVIRAKGLGATVDKAKLAEEGRLLAPVDHPDTAHLYVTGTGLTLRLHGASQARHVALQGAEWCARRLVSPQPVDQTFDRHDTADVDREMGDDGALLRSTEVERDAIASHFDRSEHVHREHGRCLPQPRSGGRRRGLERFAASRSSGRRKRGARTMWP